jgi:hypothetical protein
MQFGLFQFFSNWFLREIAEYVRKNCKSTVKISQYRTKYCGNFRSPFGNTGVISARYQLPLCFVLNGWFNIFHSWGGGFFGLGKIFYRCRHGRKEGKTRLIARHYLATDLVIKLLLYVDLQIHIFQETIIISPVVYKVIAGLFCLFKISFKIHGVE